MIAVLLALPEPNTVFDPVIQQITTEVLTKLLPVVASISIGIVAIKRLTKAS